MHQIPGRENALTRVLRHLILIVLVTAFVWLLPGSVDRSQAPQSAAAASDPVIAAAGDIACDPADANFANGSGNPSACRQKFTSDLLVNAGLSAVLDLGDNQYFCGGLPAFLQSYDLSWGRVKSITHPSVGNHEYLTAGGTGCDITNEAAAGYFQYFGSAAGTPGQGYYSFDIGAWHIIALNSNCGDIGGCSPSSAEYQWLQSDLSSHKNLCTLAYWHIPLFSSGGRAAINTQALWNLLYSKNADLILNGHDHIYERFAPQDPSAVADPSRGIREFIVGTGGSNHTAIAQVAANSEVRNTNTYGVLKLTLHSTGYDWKFQHESAGSFSDSGTDVCHGDGSAPTAPTNFRPTSVAWNEIGLSWTASTDNVGVTGYQVFRDGTQIATVKGTSYTDDTVQPGTNYTYYVTATDASGLTSRASNTISQLTPVPPNTLVFTPTDDTYIESGSPTTNFGASRQLLVDNSPVRNMLLKFTVSGVNRQEIISAKLRLYCLQGSGNGGAFHRVSDTTWSEDSVNWNTAPASDPAIVDTLGSVSAGHWYEVDVTSLVTGDGTYSLRATSSSTDGAYYSSKEGTAGFAPQLLIALDPSGPTSTATATATHIRTPTPTPAPQTRVLFGDGFELGNLSKWTVVHGLTVQKQQIASGRFAVRAASTGVGPAYALKRLASPQRDLYYRIRFKLVSPSHTSVNMIKLRTASGAPILSVGVNSLGHLRYLDHVAGIVRTSAVVVHPGSWQTLSVHLHIASQASRISIQFNGAQISALSRKEAFGNAPIQKLQLGENITGLRYNIAFDNVVAWITTSARAPSFGVSVTDSPSEIPASSEPATVAVPTNALAGTPEPDTTPGPIP